MELSRTEGEICELLNKVEEGAQGDSRFPGENYEEGIFSAIRWIVGEIEDYPYPER